MNKTELIAAVAEDVGVGKKDTEQVLNAFFSTVQETLKQNDKVQIPGFGSFEVRERAARTGRNPHTGETIEIAAAKVPAFKPEKGLKDAIQYNKMCPHRVSSVRAHFVVLKHFYRFGKLIHQLQLNRHQTERYSNIFDR